MLIWNYAAVLPENAPPTELGRDAVVRIPLGALRVQLGVGVRPLTIKTWMVSETLSNAHGLHVSEGKVDERSRLQLIEDKRIAGDARTLEMEIPKCSVAFLMIAVP